jgi:hypothetical protein
MVGLPWVGILEILSLYAGGLDTGKNQDLNMEEVGMRQGTGT